MKTTITLEHAEFCVAIKDYLAKSDKTPPGSLLRVWVDYGKACASYGAPPKPRAKRKPKKVKP